MRRYVVTGASSGIGESVARMLLDRGDSVLLVARRAERLAALAAGRLGAHVLTADLAERGSAVRVAEEAKRALGPLDGFVHCAGFAAPAPVGMIDEETVARLFAVHATFPALFLGKMARRDAHADGASAVLVSSRSARSADPGNAAYAAAKGAVEGFYETARVELAARGVRLEVARLSEVDTEMARATWMRTAPPERVAEIMSRHPGGLPSADDAARGIVELLDGGSR